MSEVAGTLIDAVLQRVRDPQGATHSRAFVRSILSQAQRMVNAQIEAVTASASLTTHRYRQFYPINSLLPNSVKVIGVREDGRDLSPANWREFSAVDRRWFRAVGPRMETFSVIGRDLLILHPSLDVDSSVSVIYSKLTDDLTGDGTATELDDSDLPAVLDLTEVLLLVRARKVKMAQPVLERMAGRLGLVLGKNV